MSHHYVPDLILARGQHQSWNSRRKRGRREMACEGNMVNVCVCVCLCATEDCKNIINNPPSHLTHREGLEVGARE